MQIQNSGITTMADPNAAVVSCNGVSLSLGDWLAYLKRRGQLRALLLEAVLDHLITRRAAAVGLTVTDAELQAAANAFRRRQGMASATDFHAWLARERLTVEDFEQCLEADLLADKFKDHLTCDRIAGHFAAHRDSYARARLRLILVAREDLARELLAQIRDEGCGFAELAREYSLHPSRTEGGRLGLLLRRQLSVAIGDAVFAARQGEVVGPLATPQGFQLFQVEQLLPAEPDAEVTAWIRQELYDAWVREQFAGQKLEVPLLEAL
jgi:parvulin-like peptidyl-prolyl isomerase